MFELLVVLTIIGIFSVLVYPSFGNFLVQTQSSVLQSQLIQAIEQARRAASTHGFATILCQSKDQQTCSGEWINGFLIFVDEYADGKIHESAQILTSFQYHSLPGKLYFRSYPYYRKHLLFLPNRHFQDNGTFWYCPSPQLLPAWALVVTQTGYLHVEYPSRDKGLFDVMGKSLTCSTP